MADAGSDRAAILARLPVRADEDPFVVAIGGFYRRWFNLVDDLQLMIDTVAKIKSTEDEDWVPAWSAVAARIRKGRRCAARKRGDKTARATAYIQAKTYYSLARFPSPYWSGSTICPPTMSPIKAQSYDRLPALLPASATALLADQARKSSSVRATARKRPAYLRLPKGASKAEQGAGGAGDVRRATCTRKTARNTPTAR